MSESSYTTEENILDMTTNQLTAIRNKEERLKKNYSQQAMADHLGMNIELLLYFENIQRSYNCS